MKHGIIGMKTRGWFLVDHKNKLNADFVHTSCLTEVIECWWLAHLGYKPLGASCDVLTCRMVPPHIRVLFEECAGVVPALVGIATEDPHVEHDVPLEPILSQSVNRKRELCKCLKPLLGPILEYMIHLPRNYDD